MTKPYPKLVTQALCLDPSDALAWLQAQTSGLADPDRVEAMICAKRIGRATSKAQIEDALSTYRDRPTGHGTVPNNARGLEPDRKSVDMIICTESAKEILKALGLSNWHNQDILDAITALKAQARPEPEPGSLDWALAQPEGTKFVRDNGRVFTLRCGVLHVERSTPYAVIGTGWLTGWELFTPKPKIYTRKQALAHTFEHGSKWRIPDEDWPQGVYEAWDENRMLFVGAGSGSWDQPELLIQTFGDWGGWVMVDPGTDRDADPDTLGSMDC